MSETINLNNVTDFRISDLIGTSSPRKNQECDGENTKDVERRSRKSRNSTKNLTMEPSSFKLSNKLAVHGNKPKKVKQSVNQGTDLLWLHEKKLKYFKELQDVILPQRLEALKKLQNSAKKDQRKIAKLKSEIRDIETKKEELDYTAKTQSIVEEYKRMLENEDDAHLEKDTSGSITQYIGKYDNVDKQRLTEDYCRVLNNGLMINVKKLKFDNSLCTHCGGETQSNEGFISCTECGMSSDKSIHDFRLSYHDYQEILVKSPFSYKRINRFQEILATLQAKENSEIPEHVMSSVQKEIDKEQNVDVSTIDNKKIRYYLKRLSLTNYYEHIPHILNKVNGIPPIQIPLEVEEKLREMFKMIQEPFEIVKERICPTRLSFLSYNFVLYKFCELLDLEEYQQCFTLLKSIEKLRLQDKIWKGICEILDWEYIPSI